MFLKGSAKPKNKTENKKANIEMRKRVENKQKSNGKRGIKN